MKFKDLKEPFINYKKDYIRVSTLSHYVDVYNNHLVPYFGELNTISQPDVDSYLHQKADSGFSKKGLESHVTVLKTIQTWSKKFGIFEIKTFKANYPLSAREKTDFKPLNVEEARVFTDYCEKNFTFVNLILYTALFTGLRAGELCALQWKDIDTERGVLSVNKIVTRVTMTVIDPTRGSELTIGPPKTAESVREVPLAKKLLGVYKILNKIVNPEWFIATNKPAPCEPKTIRDQLDKILLEIDLPSIRLHDLRHTFATQCISSGIDAKTVSVLLGHSSVSTTLNLYMHTDDDSKTDAINKLSKKMQW